MWWRREWISQKFNGDGGKRHRWLPNTIDFLPFPSDCVDLRALGVLGLPAHYLAAVRQLLDVPLIKHKSLVLATRKKYGPFAVATLWKIQTQA